MSEKSEKREITLHGHEHTYRVAGEQGPVVVLIHGIAGTSATWESVLPLLGENHIVVAPDLLGHGDTAKPRTEYSLGAYASGVRDLMFALGHERATLVGHSLGGGVAMQFAYQFPEIVERLVLVSSGGLGRELNLLLRSAALPGAEFVLPLLFSTSLLSAGNKIAEALSRIGLRAGPDLEEIGRGYASLCDTGTRQAFIHTVRSLIDPGGQRVDASDRLYLAAAIPTLIIWGERDTMIPVEHGRAAHRLVPWSRLEIFERAGHFPHLTEPCRFAAAVASLITETEAAELAPERLRELLAEAATGTDG